MDTFLTFAMLIRISSLSNSIITTQSHMNSEPTLIVTLPYMVDKTMYQQGLYFCTVLVYQYRLS
jgi:hypothetical protein